MNDLPRKPVAIAIKSYIHAPRVLSVAEVIRQLASVFPDLDRTTIAHRVRKSRRWRILPSPGRRTRCERAVAVQITGASSGSSAAPLTGGGSATWLVDQ